ncbi:MAG: hypothetical protein ACP5NX_02345 [Candidatus Bilamarchaeaceae archaeon]
MELKELLELIKKQRWQNAKTYEKYAPHEYFVKEWNPELFSLFSDAIRQNGNDEWFILKGNRKQYRYLYIEGYRYWIDDDVLNRTKTENIVRTKDGASYQKTPEEMRIKRLLGNVLNEQETYYNYTFEDFGWWYEKLAGNMISAEFELLFLLTSKGDADRRDGMMPLQNMINKIDWRIKPTKTLREELKIAYLKTIFMAVSLEQCEYYLKNVRLVKLKDFKPEKPCEFILFSTENKKNLKEHIDLRDRVGDGGFCTHKLDKEDYILYGERDEHIIYIGPTEED